MNIFHLPSSIVSVVLLLSPSFFALALTEGIRDYSEKVCRHNASANDGASKSIDLGILHHPFRKCGAASQTGASELGELILAALRMITVKSGTICAIEVGTGTVRVPLSPSCMLSTSNAKCQVGKTSTSTHTRGNHSLHIRPLIAGRTTRR